MLEGVCIDTGGTLALKRDTTYFLFPNGENLFYVSRFPNEGAHFGCFRADLFQVEEKHETDDLITWDNHYQTDIFEFLAEG